MAISINSVLGVVGGYDFKECMCTYKNTHISAATYPRTLNLVSKKSINIACSHDGLICKLSNFHIHEF